MPNYLSQIKEVEMGGVTPRMLCLDDYFMTDVEQEVVDSNGKKSTKIVCQQFFSYHFLQIYLF